MVTFTLRSRCFFKKLKEFGDEFEITKLQEIFEKLFFIMYNKIIENDNVDINDMSRNTVNFNKRGVMSLYTT